jgi:hypothetical protein
MLGIIEYNAHRLLPREINAFPVNLIFQNSSTVYLGERASGRVAFVKVRGALGEQAFPQRNFSIGILRKKVTTQLSVAKLIKS